jgi:sugar phosphate isomerase/epimerase
MIPMTRRSFTLSAVAAASLQVPAFGRKLSTFGVQLYTVRSIINKDPERVLNEIESAGYREIEATSDNLDRIMDAVRKTKMRPVSIHLDTALFTTNREKLGPALENAKKYGFEYVVCPYIAPKDRGGVDVMKRLADNLDKAGAQCLGAGLKLCYHNHAFEFAPAGPQGGKDGSTLMDVLLANTDSKHLGWEMDIFWVAVTGNDPSDLLKKYPGRVALMHLKDKADDVAKRFDENVPRTAFKEVGMGKMDLKRILHAATQTGVKHFFVEQDSTPGDPVASLKISASHLKSFDF